MAEADGMLRWERRQRISEIHDIVRESFSREKKGYRPVKLLNELKTIGTKRLGKTPTYLEAKVMICLGSGLRPARVRRLIDKLRRIRVERDEGAAFDTFEAFLQAEIGQISLVGQGINPAVSGQADAQDVRTAVDQAVQFLQENGGEVFLNSGTLLGVIRDKQLVAHGAGIDLAVLLKAKNTSDAAVEWCALGKRLHELGMLEQRGGGDSRAVLKLKSKGACQIDLVPSWVAAGKVYVYPHTYGELSKKEVFPTQICAVSGQPLPAEPEKMLHLNYGEGWGSSDEGFRFSWQAADKKFATFLGRLKSEDGKAA